MQGTRIFNFGDRNVGVVDIDGKPWFVAKDVCRILGLKNTSKAVKDLDHDEKGLCETYTPGGNQKVTVVSEPGLYNLVGRSNKPKAKEFSRWIRHTVLPALNKNGYYAEDGISEIQMIHKITGEMLKQQEKLRNHDKKFEDHEARLSAVEGRHKFSPLPGEEQENDCVN